MHSIARGFLLILLTALVACTSSRPPASETTRPSRDLLLQEEIRASGQTNVYMALTALRPNWLQARGPDSFRTPTQVQVYRDDMRLGGVDMLRTISVAEISYVRYFDGISAAARWGLDHGQGVIFVSSLPR